jgi:hypothetical protein
MATPNVKTRDPEPDLRLEPFSDPASARTLSLMSAEVLDNHRRRKGTT